MLDFTGTEITIIETRAFSKINAIYKVIFDGTSISLHGDSFADCSYLTYVEFVDLLEEVLIPGFTPFSNTNISFLVFPPATLTSSISSWNLSQFTYPGGPSLSLLHNITSFSDSVSDENFTYLDTKRDYIQKCLSQSDYVIIPSPVQYIGQAAFTDSIVSSLTFSPNSSLRGIHPRAFNGSSISSIVFPFGYVPTFGLFQNLLSLTSVSIQETIPSLAVHLFKGCSNLTSVIINGSELLKSFNLDFTVVPFPL